MTGNHSCSGKHVANSPSDSASSAVRNLNDYEIMGRKLRVDFSHEQKAADDDYTPVRHTLPRPPSRRALAI